jgi:hypothetical protein
MGLELCVRSIRMLWEQARICPICHVIGLDYIIPKEAFTIMN